MTRKTSACAAASKARPHASSGRASPNQTTAGRSSAPHRQRGGSGSIGTCSFCSCVAHPVHCTCQMSPCNFTMLRLPARSWSPSTFWVTSVKRPLARHSISARARCPGFGCALWMICRRQSYHSQTKRGSRAKASGDASFSGEKFRQSPFGPRNVGIPLSAEMPAPVKATICAASRIVRNVPGESSTRTGNSRRESQPRFGYYALARKVVNVLKQVRCVRCEAAPRSCKEGAAHAEL